ncbi:hypothetical protein IV203_035497 [Nitzschia inconspicua]|uniref:Uncharacterized protein n=1 Tax=Nitzschia inconspicua TaxID=303405 RepID=A0A9K3LEA2_9STRA|nr:hypothetical protein IV203_035497 [Nitzschia inconspicua]
MPDLDANEASVVRVRERQWIYLGPIMAAPVAHIAVTLYQSAKTAQQRKWILALGVVGSTIGTIGMRLYLMAHAGYPGGPNYQMASREQDVSLQQKRQMENPDTVTILKEAWKGFG